MVLGETFRHPTSNVIVHPDNVIKKGKRILFGFQDEMECLVDGSTVYVEKDGDGTVALQVGFEKMSKSKFNGVQPEQVLNQWDSDVMRLFTVYKSPPELDLVWDSNSISGMARFLSKLRKSVMEAKIEPGKTIEDLADFQMSRDGLIQRTDEVIHEASLLF
jgi:leucyl-tRNA synthetase